MKPPVLFVLFVLALASAACKPQNKAPAAWQPKVGERVQTHFNGTNQITTVTKIVNVGDRSQTGLLVFGDGLPGVDSWWVTPAPSVFPP